MSEYLKNFIAAEGAKLKGMTLKEKAVYIWEYYKIPIIAAVVILFIAGSIINSVWINPPKKLYLQIAFYGGYVDDSSLSALCGNIEEAVMTPEERETLQVTGTYFMLDSGDPQMDMASSQKFMAMIAVQELDLLVASQEELGFLAYQNMLLPLRDILPDSQMSQYSDKLVSAPDESGAELEYAIKLDGNRLFIDNGIMDEGQCLAVVINNMRQDNARRAIEHIFNS